jgi:predicted O-methyltransferase YrrM
MTRFATATSFMTFMARPVATGALLGLVAASTASAQPANAVPSHIQSVLQAVRAADKDLLAVSEEDGRFLRVLATSSRATRALEIGGASGYSAIWIGLAMRETGGRLITIEYDAARAQALAANIRKAGLTDVVTVVAGDAFKEIPRLGGEFDFVFLDAWKPDYKRFFDLILPRVPRGGLFLAHNVVNKRDEMRDFLTAVEASPALVTTFVSPSHEGMSVSVRVR